MTSHSFYAQWRVYVDITDVVDKKVKALDCLASQRYDGDYARKRAESVDGYWGHKNRHTVCRDVYTYDAGGS